MRATEILESPAGTKVDFIGKIYNIYNAKELKTQYSDHVQNFTVNYDGKLLDVSYWFKIDKHTPLIPSLIGKMAHVVGKVYVGKNGKKSITVSSVTIQEEAKTDPTPEELFNESPAPAKPAVVKEVASDEYKKPTLFDVTNVAHDAHATAMKLEPNDPQARMSYVNCIIVNFCKGLVSYAMNNEADDLPMGGDE